MWASAPKHGLYFAFVATDHLLRVLVLTCGPWQVHLDDNLPPVSLRPVDRPLTAWLANMLPDYAAAEHLAQRILCVRL